MKRIYKVTWKLEFINHPTKKGLWLKPYQDNSQNAHAQMKEGLVRASIIGKHFNGGEEETLAQCDGWDYCLFKWLALAGAPGWAKGDLKLVSNNVGLCLVTREKEIKVFIDGSTSIIDRTHEDKKFHYATFGR